MLPLEQNVQTSAARLTPAVLQAADMLGMYHAELARVLHMLCGEIGQLANAKKLLEPDTQAWQQALLFMRFYQALYRLHDGDKVAAWHWLRANNRNLNGEPLLLIVDDDQLRQVLDYVESLLMIKNKTSEGEAEV